ncbi:MULTISPECIES: type II secretion system F family protein [unclassified Nocardioides]|uniref:type II secretion system F family protein n=1 Tax=unclassified Nocardioides TaxID=2615069 RepID=UPI0009F077B2|nr:MULTISPECIES: type II secretion system protein [unclassified Nocardioides]GAW48035.1 Integral membrane protein [Nocardioides sp. PD653-B2]GAW53662.1 Integral membrane protein [Nocardioides sp. PD653]
MSLTMFTGLLLGLALGGSLLLLVAALWGWRPTRRLSRTGHAEILFGPQARRRLGIALAVGLVVAVLTRWPVAAGASIAVIYLWPTMFGGARDAASHIERLEGLAVWTESLRDSIAGSIGLEEAIGHSIHAAPSVIQPPLQRLMSQIRSRNLLPAALAGFADEFSDAAADKVVAALILNSKLRGPGLVATLTALADSAREEIDSARRMEEKRKVLRRTATIIVVFTACLGGTLTLFSREYVAPYNSPLGQMMLAIVLCTLGAGLMWIRAAANITPPERFLVGVDQVDAAVSATGGTSR